jgi:hypothetical protein
MTKTVLYQYLGTNGTIISPVHLEDTYYVRKIQLVAAPGCLLTNGTILKKSVMVSEEDSEMWKEVPEGQM